MGRAAFLKKYSSAQSFIDKFEVSEKEITALNNYIANKKVSFYLKGNEHGLDPILKALIGRNLFDDAAYYPILNKNDNSIRKAVEVLKGKNS
jgi:hypothetical protein